MPLPVPFGRLGELLHGRVESLAPALQQYDGYAMLRGLKRADYPSRACPDDGQLSFDVNIFAQRTQVLDHDVPAISVSGQTSRRQRAR